MILILNCMKDDELSESFNRAIIRPVVAAGKRADLFRVSKPGALDVPDISNYTHIIISGSEASVTEDNPWDGLLAGMVQTAIDLRKPTLGICYGHQFLVSLLAGKEYIRNSQTPEFGWLDIGIRDRGNPLFSGITSCVCMVSHFDEVYGLADHGDFNVLASTPRCGEHAFQYKDLPVWGVQFHPEYNIEEAEEIFEIVSRQDPAFSDYFFNQLKSSMDKEQLKLNRQLLVNFLLI